MDAPVPTRVGPAAFAASRRLFVKQQRKWLEVLVSAELKNAYEVFDERGERAFSIREIGTGTKELLTRLLLGPLRPFEMVITDAQDHPVLRLKRSFRWIFHHLDVLAPDGTKIGSIERRWSWFRRIYEIRDDGGRAIAGFFGAFFRPWTFELRDSGGAELGAIKKKWAGLGREMFTDADNFAVELDGVHDARLKALVTASVALIDVVHFERSKR